MLPKEGKTGVAERNIERYAGAGAAACRRGTQQHLVRGGNEPEATPLPRQELAARCLIRCTAFQGLAAQQRVCIRALECKGTAACVHAAASRQQACSGLPCYCIPAVCAVKRALNIRVQAAQVQHRCTLLLLQPASRPQHADKAGSCLCMPKQRLGSCQLNCWLASGRSAALDHSRQSAHLNGITQSRACNKEWSGQLKR